jgi:hypothetical protein
MMGFSRPPSLKKKLQAIMRGIVEATREMASERWGLFLVKIMIRPKAVSGKNTVRRQPQRIGSYEPMVNPSVP